ncbi:class I SAM-dependent methyltransferase [Luteimonas kalidii]|uniref:Class I SAM-dependent methyltransferase n=1 Tax=Luteimonas kalidii TaxID=3042025 RepID=A0ABT6JXL5_9GAMM|nr:class I SAM-dependent methyltransferase [Luteimonas kalidii]MDH5835436.1 class I SAM-dependent methyltransferase [Luteimonas kalidii]
MNIGRGQVRRAFKTVVLAGLGLAGTSILAWGVLTADVRLMAIGLFAWVLAGVFVAWIVRGIGLLMLERQAGAAAESGRQHAEIRLRLRSASDARGRLKAALSSVRMELRATRDELAATRAGLSGALQALETSTATAHKDVMHLVLRTFRSLDAGLASAQQQDAAEFERIGALLDASVGVLENAARDAAAQQQDGLQLLLESLRSVDVKLDAQEAAVASQYRALSEGQNETGSALREIRSDASSLRQELVTRSERLESGFSRRFDDAGALLEPLGRLPAELQGMRKDSEKQATLVQGFVQGKNIEALVASSLKAVSASTGAMGLARRLFDHVKPDVVVDIAAMQTLRERAPAVRISPPMTRFSMEPAAILAVVEGVTARRPGLIVELGSGASTVWIAGALAALGSGRLVSIEHDPAYLRQTRGWLSDNDLLDWVDLRLAEIKPCQLSGGETANWYDLAQLEGLDDVEMLLVDGPPQSTGPMARLPAFVQLRPALRTGATIFVDDATRGDELEIIEAWRGLDEKLSKPKVCAGRMVAMRFGADDAGAS